ncbi:ATP-dependent helicase [Fibrobacter sp.]|uniref:ATP-dependent helicase n=1 Tax=Fibrobacter sp. TaxID=35828 RepID=UPI0025BA55EC|nr:UvrD-helicase domain-containing protein [Fibrobacter sp.]MCI6437508.1 UvrD-helicase domain-containing protein [Fibrobacter sp.]MDD7497398.1 UvrD-helicase domain-containing protein [Fibrobacter sp.]MDY5724948.1 UvrD-helicase domain-containing protein [Fibrobacter sp.]
MANIVDGAVLDRELNPEQAAAAKKIDGPMLILAGAGSGKTRCITYKIAHLVSQHGVEADRILAVTFTNKAAREMKSRIQKLLDCNMNFSWMGTFHSVCLRLLKLCLSKESVVAAMGGQWYDGNFSIYDDDDQKRILKEILKEDLGDNFEASEVKKLHAAISKYKNTILNKGGFALLQTPDIALEMATFADEEKRAKYYAEYQKRLKESNAMDFDDLLFNTVYMLQKLPKLADQLAQRFRYVVVDEYQDTNDVQYELLKLLINEQKNVTVVGDDDQSIYGWRGANIKIIRNFHRDFAPVTIVKLERNYRSTANIVKGAGSVIAHNIRPQEMQKNVFSKEDAGELIHVRHFMDDRGEASAIADTIAKAGPDFYAKTAVFYRTNAQSRALEKALNDRRIPSVIFGGMRFWDRKEIKDVLAYLRLLANEKDDAAYLRVINTPPRAIGKTTVENILERERNGEGTFWENLLAEANGVGRTAPKLKGFTDLVLNWKALVAAGETPLPILAERIINDVGYKEFLRKEDEITADERIGNLDEMVNAIREFDEEHPGATLDAFLQDISLLTDADKKVDNSKGQVTLMTIHMAKGLEFNTVHIAGCDEEIFPLIRMSSMMSGAEMNEQMEEERRLFYVGCTRAEKQLYLYHAERRFFQGNIRPFAPSRFLKELDPSVVDFKPCFESGFGGGFGGDDFNQDFSGQHFSRPPRPNIPPSSPRRPSGSFGGSSSRPNNFGSHGFSRPSIPNSVKKNDKRIVYRNPIKVAAPPKPAEPSGPRVVFDEFSENPFHPGVRVRHSKYGVGTIVKCYGSGDNARVDVRFGNDPTIRTIILKYAALQIVG